MATISVDVEVDLSEFDDEEIEEYYFQHVNSDTKKIAEILLKAIKEKETEKILFFSENLALAVTGRLV